MKKPIFSKTFYNHLAGAAVVFCSVSFGMNVIQGNLFTSISMAFLGCLNYYIMSEEF